jgi:hypothetical protein
MSGILNVGDKSTTFRKVEAMDKSLKAGLVALGAILAAAGPACAEGASPIFGNASVQVTTPSENKAVVGKGLTAALYAYYGSYYTSLAVYYGDLGDYYNAYNSYYGGSNYQSSYRSNYGSASSYSYNAYLYYYYASIN